MECDRRGSRLTGGTPQAFAACPRAPRPSVTGPARALLLQEGPVHVACGRATTLSPVGAGRGGFTTASPGLPHRGP